MKKIMMVLVAAIVVMTVSAQSIEEQKKKIADIKKNSSYIYAEITTTDQQQAIDLATDMLNQNVNEWVTKQKKFAGANKIITINTNYTVEQITMPRANMFRAFMYIKKSDILPAENVEVKNAPTEIASAVPAKAVKTPVAPQSFVATELIKLENTGQLSEKLKELKASGKVSEYSNLRGLQGKNLSEYMMVVFNKDGVIEAVLSEGDSRTNIKTGALDQLSNYKGRGAIGVKENK